MNYGTFCEGLELNDPLVGGTKLTETYSNGIAFDQNTNFLYFFYKTPDSESAAANGIERVPGREETLKEPGCMGSEDKCEFNIVWWDFGSYLAEPDDPPIWNWLRWPKEEEPKGFGYVAGQTYSPENAAFYGDSLWYFADGRSSLYKLKIGKRSVKDGKKVPVAKDLDELQLDLPY